jgi:hypothetical protein
MSYIVLIVAIARGGSDEHNPRDPDWVILTLLSLIWYKGEGTTVHSQIKAVEEDWIERWEAAGRRTPETRHHLRLARAAILRASSKEIEETSQKLNRGEEELGKITEW